MLLIGKDWKDAMLDETSSKKIPKRSESDFMRNWGYLGNATYSYIVPVAS